MFLKWFKTEEQSDKRINTAYLLLSKLRVIGKIKLVLQAELLRIKNSRKFNIIFLTVFLLKTVSKTLNLAHILKVLDN